MSVDLKKHQKKRRRDRPERGVQRNRNSFFPFLLLSPLSPLPELELVEDGRLSGSVQTDLLLALMVERARERNKLVESLFLSCSLAAIDADGKKTAANGKKAFLASTRSAALCSLRSPPPLEHAAASMRSTRAQG